MRLLLDTIVHPGLVVPEGAAERSLYVTDPSGRVARSIALSPAQSYRTVRGGVRTTLRRTVRGVLLLTFILAGSLSAAGCSHESRESPARTSPTLALIDSVILHETDSVFVGQATGFAAVDDGSYLIADVRNATVHHYDAEGQHLDRIGRRGTGPGEFQAGPGAVVMDGDSLVAIHDGFQVTLWSHNSGGWEFRWARAIPGTVFPQASLPLAGHNGRFFFRIVDRARRTTLGAVSSASDTPVFGGPFPQLLGRSRIIDDVFSSVRLAPLTSDTLAMAVTASDYVFIGPFRGPFDSTYVPPVRRRGSLPRLLEAVRDEDPRSAEAALYQPSEPFALGRLSSGRLVYVAGDLTHLKPGFSAELFVSIVDPVGRRSCTDARVPVSEDPLPLVAFRGDTLLVLNQEVTDDQKAQTIVRRFIVRTDDCAWVLTNNARVERL